MSKTACFTGRRPKDLYGYNHDAYIPMVEAIKRELRILIAQGYTKFITGGAQGFDQLAFWAVNSLKQKEGYNIQNIVYVPFEGQEMQWKETGLFSQKEYNLMLKLADGIKTLRVIDRTNKYEVTKALYSRNHDMVDDSDLVFGLFPDYSWLNKEVKSGTAECLRYAHNMCKPIYQMFVNTLACEYVYKMNFPSGNL